MASIHGAVGQNKASGTVEFRFGLRDSVESPERVVAEADCHENQESEGNERGTKLCDSFDEIQSFALLLGVTGSEQCFNAY